jgi:photosystem II stability/assembly factor-like uncharacterized protein
MNSVSTSARFCALICIILASVLPSLAQNYWEKLASPPSAHPGPLLVANILITKQGTYLSATSEGSGVYRSPNRGGSWVTATPYANYDHGIAFCVNPSGDIFVATNNANGGNDITKIGRSKDDGLSYQNVPSYPASKSINSMICTSAGTILIGTNRDGIYRSTDDAATWSLVNFTASKGTTALCDAGNGTIYAGTDGDGIYQTKDNGNTWTLVISSINLSNIKCLTSDKNGNLYAGSNYGAYRSIDAGKTWEEIFNTGSSGGSSVSAILVSSQGRIYLSVFGNGVYCSADNGISWTQLLKGFTTTNVNTMAIDSTGSFLVGTAKDIFRNTTVPVLNASVNINNQEINFGDLAFPEQRDSTVTITNIGGSTLEVTKISISGASTASFQVIPSDPFSLAENESKKIIIRCKPVKNGDLEATLKLTSNSAGETSEILLLGSSSGIPVNVQEVKLSSFGVEHFPNPSLGSGTLKIASDITSKGIVRVVTMLGMPIYSREFMVESDSPLLFRCDIPAEAAGGLYQVIVTVGQRTVSVPITVIR